MKVFLLYKEGEYMLEIKGKYNTAIVNQNTVEEYAIAQIKRILDNEIFKDS